MPKRGRPLLGAPFKVKGSTTIRYLAVNDDVAALLNKEIQGQVPSPQYKCPVDNCPKVCGNPGALANHVSLRHPTFNYLVDEKVTLKTYFSRDEDSHARRALEQQLPPHLNHAERRISSAAGEQNSRN